ncbi:MAG: serine/threonine-protein kinase [Myxococcota bacterium]|jgi:serine/threonine-protein kinase
MSVPARQAGRSAGAWEPGTLVGRYMLLTPLAQGGMAEIWLARASGLQGFEKLVVIKRMDAALRSEPEYVEMFLTEARLAAQLSHPHVVQIYELGEQDDSMYIVMEYLDGENLAVVRRAAARCGQPMSDPLCVRLVSWAAEGLHYAHTRVGHDGQPLHIVHRDVSPQNLIATMDGNLKVVDFGIAKTLTQHTHSGKLKGKFAYMAPEQARGERVDARSDVFALGIVLFELVTKTRFLPKMGDTELLATIGGTAPLPRPRERRSDVPPRLEAVILKALEREREARFQSARDFHDALESWLQEAGRPINGGEVADYLHTVFADRIQARRQLIEKAMRTDFTASAAQSFDRLARAQSGIRGGLGAEQSNSVLAGAPKRHRWVMAVAALLLVSLGVGLTVAVRPAQEPSVVVQARPAVVVEAPKASPPVLLVETVPAGATVSVDGRELGPSPQRIENLTIGDHLVQATLAGHVSSERTVTLARAGERVVVQLAMLPEAPPKVDAPLEPEPPTPKESPRPVAAAKPKPKPKPKPAEQGKLTLKTTPWTTVYLGKQKLGDTPLINVPVPAGRQVLRLVNPEKKLDSSIEVEIVPNETTVKKLSL